MKNIFKKLFIHSGEKEEIIAYKSWIVRWDSVEYESGMTLWRYKQQSEIFPSEIDAYKFAEQLSEAYKLTKSTVYKSIRVEENQNKLATIK